MVMASACQQDQGSPDFSRTPSRGISFFSISRREGFVKTTRGGPFTESVKVRKMGEKGLLSHLD
jgi:hypothetical protein